MSERRVSKLSCFRPHLYSPRLHEKQLNEGIGNAAGLAFGAQRSKQNLTGNDHCATKTLHFLTTARRLIAIIAAALK
jgi:hypothetical protein